MMSAALNKSCKIPEHMSGREKSRIFLKSGPLHMSISYDFFTIRLLPAKSAAEGEGWPLGGRAAPYLL